MALYQSQPDRNLRAKALAKEYGIGGHSHDYLDGSRGFVNHDWKGLEFDRYPEHKKFTLSWTQVEKYIDLMVQSDRYLTDKEKEHIEALDVLLNAWNGEPDSMSSANLLGICRFVELYHSEYSKSRLIAKLRQVDAFTIFRLARTAGVNLPGKTKYLQQVYTKNPSVPLWHPSAEL